MTFFFIVGPFVGILFWGFPKKKPLGAHFEKSISGWFLSIQDGAEFSKTVLAYPEIYSALKDKPRFTQALCQKIPSYPSAHFRKKLKGSIFSETIPMSGYDVGSVTNESKFFEAEKKNDRQLFFLAFPILQYHVSKRGLSDFFFETNEVKLLEAIKPYMRSHQAKNLFQPFLNRIDLFQLSLKEHQYSLSEFPDKIAELLGRYGFFDQL